MAKGKKKKGGKMCVLDVQMGCGKGRKCDISLYILPQGSTKEYFNEYAASRLETMKQDSTEEQVG